MRYVEMANELTVNRRIRIGMAQTLMITADRDGVADYGDFKIIRDGAEYRIEEPPAVPTHVLPYGGMTVSPGMEISTDDPLASWDA